MNQTEIFPQIIEVTKVIQENPDDVAALRRRATLLAEAALLDDAIADLNHIIDDLHLPNADDYQLRGSIRMRQGDRNGAFADLQELVKLNPELLQHLSGEYASKKSGHC